ncbi:UDP-GlcNAc3NAcA epimerase [Actinomadura pelletieri DSM 43383]|uniref:UDP-GlcNAc3NAcA epimerase n=1 Tax=Actinomadura pelletieri DSM 43383 TaxID=1120940 RepID=A0A495QKN6_9ACTN|nr:UDP-N-acetylglucosamine 2-epimerase [Actinomadura pelletieri]RKS73094.1 UDP-GlcNAc3NAcA epimerase [Actinomadura pelletieri DSM 43383]
MDEKWTIVAVVGTRPQIIKCAAMQEDLRGNASRVDRLVLLDTGQHYDPELAALPRTDLGVDVDVVPRSGGSGGDPTVEEVHDAVVTRSAASGGPRAVLVMGDTRSTLLGARAAVRAGLPLVYAEAGLGSRTPGHRESEIRRAVVKHADVLVCWSESAAAGLHVARPGAPVLVFDDPHLGFVRRQVAMAGPAAGVPTPGVRDAPAVLTLHKSWTLRPEVVTAVFEALAEQRQRAVLLLTPQLRRLLETMGPVPGHVEPRDGRTPRETWRLVAAAPFLVTDSGTMPREAAILGRRSVLVRAFSGNGDLIDRGIAVVAGTDSAGIAAAIARVRRAGPFDLPYRATGWHEILDRALDVLRETRPPNAEPASGRRSID